MLVRIFLGGSIPYGTALAYVAQKRRSGDQQSTTLKFNMLPDMYCEPSYEAYNLMVKTNGQDLLDLLEPLGELVEGTCACYQL